MSCVFCNKIAEGDVEEMNSMGVFHFEPLNPVTPGHRLFIPREHIETARLSSGMTGLLFSAATQWAQKNEEDFNLIVNSGPAASQSIKHLHIHYVPRVEGDGLNLPWTGQKKGHFGGYLGGGDVVTEANKQIDDAITGVLETARALDKDVAQTNQTTILREETPLDRAGKSLLGNNIQIHIEGISAAQAQENIQRAAQIMNGRGGMLA